MLTERPRRGVLDDVERAFLTKQLLRNDLSAADRERLSVDADVVIHTPQAVLVFLDTGGHFRVGNSYAPCGMSRAQGGLQSLHRLVAAGGRVVPLCRPTAEASRVHLVRAAKAIGRVHVELGKVLRGGIHVTKRGAYFEQRGDELPVRIDCK